MDAVACSGAHGLALRPLPRQKKSACLGKGNADIFSMLARIGQPLRVGQDLPAAPPSRLTISGAFLRLATSAGVSQVALICSIAASLLTLPRTLTA